MNVLDLLRQLPVDPLDVVYGDPNYNVGYNGRKYTLEWEKYIDWHVTLAAGSLRALKPTSNLSLINYPKQNAYLRVRYLDEHACDVHECVWIYNTNIGMTENILPAPIGAFSLSPRPQIIIFALIKSKSPGRMQITVVFVPECSCQNGTGAYRAHALLMVLL
jgi:hypothetical protein